MNKAATPFTTELIAPCGMNCALCSHYQAFVAQAGGAHRMAECPGCRVSGRGCAVKRHCLKAARLETIPCVDCTDFPCAQINHIDERYRTRYRYSMIETIRAIKSKGMTATLRQQREHYKCQRCGGVICVHNGKCYRCDEVKSWRG